MIPETPEIPKTSSEFKEVPCYYNMAPTCVDGRNCEIQDFANAPQMLGGSLNLILLKAINKKAQFDENFVQSTASEMKALGLAIGGHTDDHQNHEGECGCGFADNLKTILQRVKDDKEEIKTRILDVYEKNKALYDAFFGEGIDVAELLNNSLETIVNYSLSNVMATGANIVEGLDTKYELQGDHNEQVAFVNLKEDTTFNVVKANNKNAPAFNLDLWMVKKQAEEMELDPNSLAMQSLILYVATEMVLVEDKGKNPLPVVTNG